MRWTKKNIQTSRCMHGMRQTECASYTYPTIHTYIHTCIHATAYNPYNLPPYAHHDNSQRLYLQVRITSCWLARAELAVSNSREFRVCGGGRSRTQASKQASKQTNKGQNLSARLMDYVFRPSAETLRLNKYIFWLFHLLKRYFTIIFLSPEYILLVLPSLYIIFLYNNK